MKLTPRAEITAFSWKNFLFLGTVHIIAAVLCVPFFSWGGVIAFGVLYYISGMVGITFSFHRMLTHRSFQASRWLEKLGALCGTLACQGGPISWISGHRVHHAYSDKAMDPHDASRGFWHSHFYWMMDRRQDLETYEDFSQYAPDISSDPFMVFLENNMVRIQFVLGFSLLLLGAFLSALAKGTIGMDWQFGISLVTYGIFVRLVVVYHVTWLVNSASHTWGSQPHGAKDLSRNNWWVALLAFGEGWHNNHHFQPRSARHGWTLAQFDKTWILIRICESLGFVKNVIRPRVVAAPKVTHAQNEVGLSVN